MKEFLEMIEKQHENVIAIDFDGVIHDDSKGFHDGTIYGKPISGSYESLKRLSETYQIIIFTCKANPERPLINGKTGTELIWEWLKKHNLDQYIETITHEKPRALYYIDDKGITFYNWEQTLKEI